MVIEYWITGHSLVIWYFVIGHWRGRGASAAREWPGVHRRWYTNERPWQQDWAQFLALGADHRQGTVSAAPDDVLALFHDERTKLLFEPLVEAIQAAPR